MPISLSKEEEDFSPFKEEQLPKEEVKESAVEAELKTLEEMLADPNCSYRNLIAQVYKVMAYLQRLAAKENKLLCFEKEDQILCNTDAIENTYNGRVVTLLRFLQGGSSIVAGLLGIGSIWKEGLEAASKGLSFVAQGIDPLGKIPQESIEAKRFILNTHQEFLKQALSRMQQSYSEGRDLSRRNVDSASRAEQELHRAFSESR